MRRIYVLVLLLAALPAAAATIFSNLVQPGDQFGPDPVGVGAIPVPGVFVYSATNFTPGAAARLDAIEIPIAVVSGPAEVDVMLMANAGNIPGAVIEAFHLTGVTGGPMALLPMNSVLHPLLAAGEQYWVAVTGGTGTTFAVWGLTLFAGDPTAGGAGRSVVNGFDSGWAANPGTRTGAVRLSGEEVPEPGTMWLAGAALLAMRAARGAALRSR
jgi:hypothetical protein